MRDYYEILSVGRDADLDAVKKAYRKLALRYHPDRNGGDKEAEERFREATEAYEVLQDPQKRAAYDRFGHAGVKSGAGAGAGRPGGFSGGMGFEDALNTFMQDFGGFGGFEDLFGGGRRGSRRVQRGKDIRIKLRIPLEEVATGARRSLRVKLLDACDTCEGTGAADGGAVEHCDTCEGAGQVRRVQNSVFGQVVTASTCPACHGEGRRIRNVCPECQGEGRLRVERTIDVEIPAGVTSENYLTLRGQGNVGPRGGPRGDIAVILQVEDDPRFLRDGDNLLSELPVSFSQAALGVRTTVETIHGEEEVRVPAGTQSGEVIVLRGKGLPRLGGGTRGDQHVRVHVWTPADLDRAQEDLFRELADIEGDPPQQNGRSQRSGLWSRMKEAFAG